MHKGTQFCLCHNRLSIPKASRNDLRTGPSDVPISHNFIKPHHYHLLHYVHSYILQVLSSIIKVDNILPPFTNVTPILLQYFPFACRLISKKRHFIISKHTANHKFILFYLVATYATIGNQFIIQVIFFHFLHFFVFV